jgi:hypothetical protein
MWMYPPLILALVATLADAVGAQVPDSVWRAAVARLTPGTTVRLHSRDRGRIEGRLVGPGGTTLNLETGATRTEWSTATLDSLWVRRTSTKTGAIIGAISGAVAGGLLGAFANEVACQDEGGDPCPEAIPLLGLAGAAAGALVGGVIGSLIPKWQRKVPSE